MRVTGRGLASAVLVIGVLAACSPDDAEDRAARGDVTTTAASPAPAEVQSYDVPPGSHPHDVAAAADGTVWYTAQATGELGRLDPATGRVTEIALGRGSSPHGVVVGPDDAPWVTDSGLNAILRVDPQTSEIRRFPLPASRPGVQVHTAVFDRRGTLWFTGNAGVYGRLRPDTGSVDIFDAPGGGGPYGITATPDGDVYFASLQGSHMARVDPDTGAVTVLRPPTPDQGTRRVWTDSKGRVWCSQWDAGQLARYDPATGQWEEWRLPGDHPQAYAVYVDDGDVVWLSDFGANAIVRFDPADERFTSYPLPHTPGEVRQLHGRPGEVWGAESANDKLVVVRTAQPTSEGR